MPVYIDACSCRRRPGARLLLASLRLQEDPREALQDVEVAPRVPKAATAEGPHRATDTGTALVLIYIAL